MTLRVLNRIQGLVPLSPPYISSLRSKSMGCRWGQGSATAASDGSSAAGSAASALRVLEGVATKTKKTLSRQARTRHGSQSISLRCAYEMLSGRRHGSATLRCAKTRERGCPPPPFESLRGWQQKQKKRFRVFFVCCPPSRTRTLDRLVKSELLYQLS